MIPLLFIALALGAGLAAYEFSPKAHAFVDDHVNAIRDAIAAHQVADSHLDQAKAAADVHDATQDAWAVSGPPAPGTFDPAAAWDTIRAQSAALLQHAKESLAAAHQANGIAAANTAVALPTAKTDQQMATAASSAVAVDTRQKQISALQTRVAEAMAHLGGGKCGVRAYHVTPQIKDALLAKLHAAGMTVKGQDPWDIDTHQHDVTLRAVWDPQTLILKLIVSDWGWEVNLPGAGCTAVWTKIDPVLNAVLGA
jgi:hypothetical protein